MRRLTSLMVLVVTSSAVAQTADYHQSSSIGLGGETQPGNHFLIVDWLPATLRIPVKSTPADPLQIVAVRGRRDMYCTLAGAQGNAVSTPFGTTSSSSTVGGEFNFREALYRRLSALDLAAMQAALQRANRADRSTQYRELFAVELPALNEVWQFARGLPVEEAAQMQLNTGQEISVNIENVVCATPAQIDAAIAEGKRVYAAVIAAMGGGGAQRGLGTTAPSSGLQTQPSKGK